MECVVAKALKPSLRDEMLACRSWAQDQSSNEDDDYWGASSVVSGGEELFVDGFLDLSNEDAAEGCAEEGNDEEEEEEKACSVSSSTADENSSSSFCNSAKDEFGAGIDLPTDDLAALEWLSHFVEDSFTEFPTITYTASKPSPRPSPTPPPLAQVQVPAKARSKRNRAGARVWSLHAPQPTESSTSSSSSTVTENNHDDSQKPPSKKRKPAAAPLKDRKSEPARRCSHCLVQKTPQWRTGPMGAKTLCNACGVRYKSGRLLPEYRPAGSPTFVSHVHSNSHKKVLEMRRRKEDRFEAGSAPLAVESF